MGALRNHFMNLYPYTDFHELNADWMIKMLMKMVDEVENFVAQNAIKYADPIQWNITKQYEKNTIVVDPITGTAYISNHPVPMGVALSNTHYWSVIFDLGRFVTLASQNFANTYEAVLTTTATQPTDKGNWVVWDSTLYVALNDIHVGDAYVVDGNIEKKTVEDFFKALKESLADEAQTRADEDARIELEVTDLITSQVGILSDEIAAEAQTRADEDVRIELELSDLISSEVTARIDADNALNQRIDDIIEDIGSLYIYTTFAAAKASDKAVKGTVIEITGVSGKFYVDDTLPTNEHYFTLDSGLYAIYYPFDFVDFKAWDVERTADCSVKLQDAIHKTRYYQLPLQISGRYVLSDQVNTYRNVEIVGTNGAILDCQGYTVDQNPIIIINGRHPDDAPVYNSNSPCVLRNITLLGFDDSVTINPYPSGSSQFNLANAIKIQCFHVCLNNVVIRGFNRAITNGDNTYAITFNDCRFFYNNVGAYLDGYNATNSGGIATFNGCSLANNRYGLWNLMFNIGLTNSNLNFNGKHVISQNSDSGIISSTEVYTNCEFEESTTTISENMFEDNGSEYSNRIFNGCMFYVSKVNRGYFWLKNGGSSMKFKNSWIRTFGSQDALREPKRYLVEVGNYYLGEQPQRSLVECDPVRCGFYPSDSYFRFAKTENLIDTDEKGFTATNSTITYGDEVITVTNNSANYGNAIRVVDLPAKGRFLRCCYRITSSASGARPYLSIKCLDASDNVLSDTAPSFTLSAGTPTDRVVVVDVPIGTAKVSFTINTQNNSNSTATTISGLYAYLEL